VQLDALANVQEGVGPRQINHFNRIPSFTLSASLLPGLAQGEALDSLDAIARQLLPPGTTTALAGESREYRESGTAIYFAFVVALIVVFMVLASQFESLLHPFVIMFSIPLALVGAVLALKLTGTPLSVVVFIGLIMLAGIVVKNAIVLIDRVNQLREEGVDKVNAIIQAAESRLRPIAMTTLCTLLGFMPLAIGVGDGNEVRAPMAITVIGGLAVSTLLTLIVIPCVYLLLDRRTDLAYRDRGERKHKAVVDPARLAAEGAIL